jgi:hypothetical protein
MTKAADDIEKDLKQNKGVINFDVKRMGNANTITFR